MLVALIRDLLRIPGIQVVTSWDHRLQACPLPRNLSCEVVLTTSPESERVVFERLCEKSDAAFIIAPEFHGILTARVEAATDRTRLVGCTTAATALCSDKLELARFLQSSGIRTVTTEPFDPQHSQSTWGNSERSFPRVIKPRDGAGSLLTFKMTNSDELTLRAKQILTEETGFRFIQQPFLEGTAVSCAAIVSPGKQHASDQLRIDVLPPCVQVLTADHRLQYAGANYPLRLARDPENPATGTSPASATTTADLTTNDLTAARATEELVRHCCSLIPGLHGYVGFDLLIPEGKETEPVLVEINPRLTTGFLLWQQLCNDNLAARLLGLDGESDRRPLSWKRQPASFRMKSLQQ